MTTLFFQYFRWHYSQGIVDMFHIIGNFLWFFYEFFSIPLLLKTYFVPFHRLNEEGPVGLDVGKIFERLMVNGLMRIVGMLLRTGIILFGVLLLVLTFLTGLVFVLIWLIAPLVALLLLLYGAIRIFV